MSIGPPELILVLVLVLIVFGAGKLPQVFNSLGKGIKEFRDASEGRDATTATTTPPIPTTTAPTTPSATVPGTPTDETQQ